MSLFSRSVLIVALFLTKGVFCLCPAPVGGIYYPTTEVDLIDCVLDFNAGLADYIIDLSHKGSVFSYGTGAYVGFAGNDALPPISNITNALTIQNGTIERTLPNVLSFRLLEVNPIARLRLEHVTIQNGNTTNIGGGILNRGILDINGSIIFNNKSSIDGGGIANSGTLTIELSTILGNEARSGGAVLSATANASLSIDSSTIFDNTGTLSAGGVYVFSSSGFIRNSTFSFNRSMDGGAIYASFSYVTLENSTLANNEATNDGGAIYNNNSIPIFVNNSTIVDNVAGNNGGGIFIAVVSVNQLSSTIVANNSAGVLGQDIYGNLTLVEYSLVENTADNNAATFVVNNNIFNKNPLLGPLQNNGGPTSTKAILPGSPAIGAGTANGLLFDQRGSPYTRTGGDGLVDIGAYEHQTCILANSELSFDCLNAY